MDFEKELEKLLNTPVSKPEEAMEEMTPERLIELQHETIMLQMKLIEKLSSRLKLAEAIMDLQHKILEVTADMVKKEEAAE